MFIHSFLACPTMSAYCVTPNVDINLQSAWFWAKSIVSFRERLNDSRSCWIVFIHVVWGRPGGLLQFSRGEVVKIFFASDLSGRCIMSNTHRRRRRDETVLSRRVGGVNTPVGGSWPIGCRIVNWPPTAALRVRIRRQSSQIHVHTADADATRPNSFASSASAVCIGLNVAEQGETPCLASGWEGPLLSWLSYIIFQHTVLPLDSQQLA